MSSKVVLPSHIGNVHISIYSDPRIVEDDLHRAFQALGVGASSNTQIDSTKSSNRYIYSFTGSILLTWFFPLNTG